MADFAQQWLTITTLVVAIGSALYTWLTAKATAAASKLDEVEEHVGAIDRRLQVVEGELRHLPGRDTVHAMEVSITELKGGVSNLGQSMTQVSGSVRRIEDYLMNSRKGG